MSNFIVFIISLLISLYPPVEEYQTKVEITFESVSPVTINKSNNEWNYVKKEDSNIDIEKLILAINDLNIQKGKTLEFDSEIIESISIRVSPIEAGKNVKKADAEIYDVTTYNQPTVLELVPDNPHSVNVYGSNTLVIDSEHLIKKKPAELNIFVNVKEDSGNSLIGYSTAVLFSFNLSYPNF